MSERDTALDGQMIAELRAYREGFADRPSYLLTPEEVDALLDAVAERDALKAEATTLPDDGEVTYRVNRRDGLFYVGNNRGSGLLFAQRAERDGVPFEWIENAPVEPARATITTSHLGDEGRCSVHGLVPVDKLEAHMRDEHGVDISRYLA